jgi:hypothetical protein
VGDGARFDGTNDCILAGSGALFSAIDNFTLSCWVKPANAATGVTMVVVTHGYPGTDGYYFRWRDTNFWFALAMVDLNLPVVGSVGQWQHVVGVQRAGVTFLYKNGVEYNIATNKTPIAPASRVGIGALNNSLGNYFSGNVDEVRLYNRALTADEIKQLYRMGAIPKGIR